MSNPNIKNHASKGGKARWMPKATHEGILKILDKQLPCVVLDSGERLITQDAVFKAFDRPRRGRKISEQTHSSDIKLPAFLESKNLFPLISKDDLERISVVNYLNINKKECEGYNAEIIPIVCDLYLVAREKGILTPSQVRIAEISEILVRSLSRVGIQALIDEVTGYQQIRPRDALESYLNKILGKELGEWTKKFPDLYYANIYTIKGWPEFSTSKNKYSCVGHYTNDLVYSRLGQDVLDELKERTPDTSKNKMHQWLSVDTGHPLLSEHLKGIILLQRLAIAQGLGWKRFIDMVDQIYPKKEHALDLKE